ncbi:MAG: TlyA family RNA methyltransferase [Desulfobacterota bacterium]|nr:TlyA family RNA methyltransferase [Thermodesulfobacteriota bacterium]
MRKNSERIDKLLVERGLVRSRERAKALILAGKVFADGKKVEKAGCEIAIHAELLLKEKDFPYVSRGGVKLAYALDYFQIMVLNRIALDVGASTGGFTHCLLLRGAKKVYAVDVGYGQLDWSLRNDSRVVCMEKTNIRYLSPENIADPISLAVTDTSFISLKKVLIPVIKLVEQDGEIISLIKPQFELAPQEIGKGGVVRNPLLHLKAVEEIIKFANNLGLKVIGTVESPLKGPKGNKEFFIYLKKRNES